MFVMDSESAENVEMPQNKADEEFVAVSRQTRKRKQNEEAMDTSGVSMKRPHLPPLSGDKLLVYHAVLFLLAIVVDKMSSQMLYRYILRRTHIVSNARRHKYTPQTTSTNFS